MPAFLLPLLAQLGTVSPGGAPALPQAPLEMPRRQKSEPVRAPIVVPQPRSALEECLATARTDPPGAAELAQTWRATMTGPARADPDQCLGFALSALQRWDEAEEAFLAARDDAAASDHGLKARMGELAANAALASGAGPRALATLDTAHGDALGAGDTRMAGEISIDRARALVLLGRENDAAAALSEARAAAPDSPQAWLLSATLSRRMNKLADAQQQIVEAARLLPIDPEIGLEAGVIAMLAGREDAARKSWQSVVIAAPGSDPAKTAQGYLDQLGPDTAPSGR